MTIVSEFMGWLSWNDPPRRETGRNRSRRPTVPLMRESLPGQRGRPGPPGGVEPRSHLAAAPRPRQWLVAATRVTGAVADCGACKMGAAPGKGGVTVGTSTFGTTIGGS